MPRRLLMQTFGRWHSGNFANGTAGAAFAGRISWARPQFGPFPSRTFPTVMCLRMYWDATAKNEMSCTACSVIPVDGNWLVECGKVSHGPYMSNGIAVRVAITEALALRRQAQPSKISIQDRTGRISAEYCLCADFKAVRR
jgi:hypothetical protein